MTPSTIYSDGSYLRQNPTWHSEDSEWKAGQIAFAFQRNGISGQSACEVGCGAGEVLAALQRRQLVKQLVGYEISSDAYALCKQRENESLHFILGDFREMDAHYDVLLLVDVIEHIEDLYGFLRNVRQKAEFKICHIPIDITVQSILRNLFMHNRRLVGHIHYFTKDTALATLRDCGFEVLDWFYTSSLNAHRPRMRARFANLLRRAAFRVNADLTAHTIGGYSLMVVAR